jgi:iron complex transport system substrate-binding protein
MLAALLAAVAAPGLAGATDGSRDGGGARRIVSLGPSVTEILYALGVGDRLVGVCDFCDYPPAVRGVRRVGGFTTPSIETIVALRPDLVVAVAGPATVEALETVRQTGVDTLVVSDTSLDAVWRAIADIGERTGRTEAAGTLAADMRARFAGVRARVAGAPRRRVLVVVGQTPLVVAGAGTFVNELVTIAGGTNVAADSGQPWPVMSLETVVARAPEVIIDTALRHEDGADARYWERFPTLPAVRARRVVAYASFDALRGGPRLAEAAEEFARLIHPERTPASGAAGPLAPAGSGRPVAPAP